MRKQILFIVFVLFSVTLFAQTSIDELHGDETYTASGLHSGNMIRTTFWNDGQVGRRDNSPEDIGGEWPINSGRTYLYKLSTMYNAEVRDADGVLRHIQSESNGTATGRAGTSASSGDSGPSGEWWTMAPLPGFYNEEPDPETESPRRRVAMSQWDWSWPSYWPDKVSDAVDPGWPGSWNGYFGKDILNADQESYYVIDDYNNREFAFYPDADDSTRRGLGMRVTVRGFQWSNVLVEDNLFLLYDVKNIADYEHDKVVFGMVAGPNIGELAGSGGDGDDDGGAYDLENNLGYQLDSDDVGAGGWSPVGFLGLAFFESPGNPFDGIDNDGDAVSGSGKVIDASMFEPVSYNVGDQVVLIDYKTFERTVTEMTADGVSITYLDIPYKFLPGQQLIELPHNLIDDNLNGIIDEANGSTFGEGADAIERYLYLGLKYVDYFTGEGLDNILIDERRDDNIDNDGDWDILTDDVGLDGVPRTGDYGEGDGQPTSGAGTDLPGEPHIDKTDIDESDMIGLTCFNIHSPWDIYPLYEDEILWEAMLPGYLNATGQIGNTDVIVASGYFPLKPGQTERFSVGYIMGYHEELFRNREFAEKTYLENYNFAKAPSIPELNVVPGDHQVILYWDEEAEKSVDPITGEDFEGYRIYRSTDPGWQDMDEITDGYGSAAYRRPIVQFDLINEYSGFHAIPTRGVQFHVGDNTGIVHSWVDSTAVNGQTYYYAVTSYDHGDAMLGIPPSECSKYISIEKDGTVDKGRNVGIARPEAPALGFMDADLSNIVLAEGGTASGIIGYEIIDPSMILSDHDFRVVFEDTVIESASRFLTPTTKNFSLVDITTGDTLILKSTSMEPGAEQPMINGFTLVLYNAPEVIVDSVNTMWSDDSIHTTDIVPFRYSKTNGIAAPFDYRIDFGDVGMDSSVDLKISKSKVLAGMPVNFTVTNTGTGESVPFGFWEKDVLEGEEGKFTAFTDPKRARTDQIILLQEGESEDEPIITWNVQIALALQDTMKRNADVGDSLTFRTIKPFLAHDVYEFTTSGQRTDAEMAKEQMEQIKVVPNPYVVSNSWEPLNPYMNGRGPRELHFIHLPEKCTISIFNVRGQLVRTLEHNTPSAANGTEVWDMLTKDVLEISYGIYIYYVDAGDIGQKTGKFAIVK